MNCLQRGASRTLLHERADGEPEAVEDGELVLHDVRVLVTRVRVAPLVRAEAGDDEQHEADAQVGGDHVHPHLHRQGRQEREELRRLRGGLLVQDRDTQCDERLGEVDHLLAVVGDRHTTQTNIGFLQTKQKIQ